MLEDKLLIWRFNRGSKDALQLIYEKYESVLLTLATNLLGDGYAAQDVVQDVFITFAESSKEFCLTGSLKSYLATCVANRARDRMRRTKLERSVPVDQLEQMTSDTGEPVQLVMCSEELQNLRYAMTCLPYEQREVIVLHLNSSLKFGQIAKLQEVSIKTVQSRYRYGLDKLRSMLNGEVKK
jgi:RNA polymerase sigma-70 factor, ECF subfamily